MTIEFSAGLDRIRAISAQLDSSLLSAIKDLPDAQGVGDQPWFIAGCSDGIGLQTAIAAIDAGVLRLGLGVYWEPPHFLEMGEDGAPVSPVHFARLENALALQAYAAEKGAKFEVMSANVILTPPRTLKGTIKKGESMRPLPAELVEKFEAIRSTAPTPDCVFINSVAFGKWISPRKGADAITVPSVDFEGQLVQMSTKKFHARGYEETLDTMGRNHKALMDAVMNAGWLGPKSLTAFFTWAGGSQNIYSLQGVYGFGSLGDAKLIAERDTVQFRLDHPRSEYGAHAIVRLPAFLSAALMGIPGGGLFGLASQRVLEDRGVFDDMPTLASKMIRAMFGVEWVRENPVSQIELDHAECLFVEPINAAMDTIHARIAAYRAEHKLPADKAIDVAASRQLLEGLVPAGYTQLLGRFRPGESSQTQVQINSEELSEFGQIVAREQRTALQVASQELVVEAAPTGVLNATLSWSPDGCEAVATLTDPAGAQVAHGRVEFAQEPSFVVDPKTVGTAASVVEAKGTWAQKTLAMLKAPRGLRVEYGQATTEGEELVTYVSDQAVTVLNSNAQGVLRASAL